MKPQRLAKVAMQNSPPVVHILLAKRSVEAIGVTQRSDVSGIRALSQHLRNRIAGHKVDEQKDHRDNNPDHRKRKQDAAKGIPQGWLHAVASLPFASNVFAGVSVWTV